jgi:hypothetical protein
MLRRLVLKELRETAWIGGVALVISLWVAVYAMGFDVLNWINRGVGARVPFVQSAAPGFFVLVSLLLAVGLGLRQTLGESVGGTWPFLLHRPIGRAWLIGAKLAVGLGLYLVCSAVPILLYAIWAATPGTHASPFAWWMTGPWWIACVSITALYFGAFLSGLRPGRWVGSRLLPLAAPAGLALLMTRSSLWWSVAPVAAPLLDVVLVAVILHVACTRDYP